MSDVAAIVVSVVAIGIALAWNPIVAAVKAATAHARPVSPAAPTGVWPTPTADFSFAIDALAVVRNRLVDTGCLDEPAKAAIEAVTHALISGTDK
jgi:hypothetical protein